MSFLSNLFSSDQQLVDIDKQIEDVISSVPIKDFQDNSSDDSPSELIHQLLASEDKYVNKSDAKKNNIFGNFLDDKQNSITSDASLLLDKLTVQADRASRYKTYEEIYNNVPIVKKAIEVWLSNLIQKNPVSGRSLLIKDNDDDPKSNKDSAYLNKKEAARVFADEVIDYFELIDKLKYRILPTQAMYGDAFVELINLKTYDIFKDENAMNDGFLGESSIHHTSISNTKSKSNSAADETKIKHLLETVNRGSFSIDNVCDELSDLFVNTSWDTKESFLGESLAESLNKKDKIIILKEQKEPKNLDSIDCFFEYVQNNAGELKPFLKIKNKSQEQIKKRGRPKKNPQEEEPFELRMNKAGVQQLELNLSDVLMLVHNPKKIVILQTEYGSILGYVEIADKDNIQTTNINQQLNTIIGKLITSSTNNGVNSQEEVIAKIIRLIVKKIINRSAEKLNTDPDKVLNSLDPVVYNTIKKLIVETDKDNPRKAIFKKLKARFIPVTRMFRFSTPNNEYYPYGRSFIDPLVLQSKLYILSQLSNTIMKLSRAAPIRKWIIDVGATQGQTKYIQQLKREKISLSK